MADQGLVTVRSTHDFSTTLERLLAVLKEKNVTVFSRIDHAAGAASAGLPMRPTTVVIFGNPAAGTPLMQAAQTAGIDLPLKALVWQAADGAVNLSYNEPAWIAMRHGLGSEVNQTLAVLTGFLKSLAAQATGG